MIDETAIKACSSELIWLWVVIEPIYKEILSFYIFKERNMFVAERILSRVLDMHGKHPIFYGGVLGIHKHAGF